MLSAICDTFAAEVEALDPKADDFGVDLRRLILKLARDATAEFADHDLGEVPALLERCRYVIAWLKSAAEDEDRQRRYGRQQALLNLLVLCEGICRFHDSKRKAADVDALRNLIGDALRALVVEEP
jgi:hypothetical protein